MKHAPVLVLSALVLLSSCAGSKSRLKVGQIAAGEVVEAEGMVPYLAHDVLGTKKAALVEAQKNAVEKAVGVFVSARTMVEKAVAIEANILARTEGYVKKYDILSEGRDGDFYKTKIRALVALKDLEADLKSHALLSRPELRRPRFFLSLEEKIDGDVIEDRVAAQSMRQAMIDQGFVAVGEERAEAVDIVIKGTASSHPFQANGLGGFVSYRARLSLQVTRGGEEVVTSLTQEASGLGGNPTLAGFKSLETVGKLAAADLGPKLTDLWSRGGNLLVMIEGVQSFADVERMRKHLQAQPAVQDLMLRAYTENMAQFDLQIGTHRAEELAVSLEKSRTLPVTVVESKNNVLRLQFQP